MENKRDWPRRILHGLIALYGVACLYLYYHQSIADLKVAGPIPFQSDLPLHISMVVEDHWYYSFTAYVYQALCHLCGGSTVGIALFLALVSVAAIYATELLVCKLACWEERTWHSLALAISLNFVMPIYIRFVGEYRYVSYQSANIWHNSTYLCMKLFAILTLLYYFRLEEHYREGLTWKEWLVFMGLNVICTGIKPSFLVTFSPIMGCFLLVDLFRKVPLRRILVFGSALLPSGGVILWQNAVLFGEDTGNGITVKPWFSFALHANKAKLAVICSVLFCLLVICATIWKEWRDRSYVFVIAMSALGFLEALCLVESGSRSVDGNFLWGYSICLFFLFSVCSVKCLQIRGTKAWQLLRGGLALVYGWHLYCGLYFFLRLVLGEGYWMR